MIRLIGLAVAAVGGYVAWMGWQEQQSMGSRLHEALAGSPSDRALWMLGLGALAALIGMILVVRGKVG